jgi:hypothetical protein
MEELLIFFGTHGLWLGLIALCGVVLLGVLKYCKVFKGITNETYRKLTYLICSVGFTLIGSIIYLLCIGDFVWEAFFPLAAAVWALNQTFYNLFKTTQLNTLLTNVLNWVVEFVKKKIAEKTEKTEE